MNVYLLRNDEPVGPFKSTQLAEQVATGVLDESQMACREGDEQWSQIGVLLMQEIDAARIALSRPVPTLRQPKAVSVPSVTRAALMKTGNRAERSIVVVRPPTQEKTNRRRAFITITIFAAIAYFISPYYAIWKLSSALKSGDREDLESRIDFPSLRESVKDQFRIEMTKHLSNDEALQDNPFAGLATAFAPAMVNYAVDNFVTPSGLAELIREGRVKKSGTGTEGKDQGSQKSLTMSDVNHAFFTAPSKFLLVVNGVKLRFEFLGTGWRLRKLELPSEAFK